MSIRFMVELKEKLVNYVPCESVTDTEARTKLIESAKSISELLEYMVQQEYYKTWSSPEEKARVVKEASDIRDILTTFTLLARD